MSDRDDVELKTNTGEKDKDAAAADSIPATDTASATGEVADPTSNTDPTDNPEPTTADNLVYLPITQPVRPKAEPSTIAGGNGDRPPSHEIAADEGEPDDDGEGDGDDDALDDEVYDELDAAAAQHIEDFRRPTKPWPEPVDGAALFAALVECFNRFMILPPGAAEVLSLWCIMSYALHACDMRFAVRLIITAPGANSGKTTLLDLLAYLVRHAEPTSEITPASFFRRANTKRTILIDECDHNLPSRAGTRNPLVAMINMGHKKTSAVVLRTETINKKKVTLPFPIFCPVAMAGIGDFAPNTINSRSYIVKLKRMVAHEQVEAFVADQHAPMMRALREQIHRWVLDEKDAIQHYQPDLDRELSNNRARDNSLMLLQIADVIGQECGARAREAIKAMTSGDHMDANEMLLGDIAAILLDPEVVVGDPPKPIGSDNCVFSGDLCDLIVQYYGYRETYQGFTPARLASMLSRFDIAPELRCKRRGKQVLRWYRADRFTEWFVRYGFEPPEPSIGEAELVADDGTDATPVEAAAPLHEVPNQEVAGSDVAPAPPVAAGHAAEIVYPNACLIEHGKGDKKRADALRLAVDAAVLSGKIDPAGVVFASSRFWIVSRDDGTPFYAHLTGIGELELLPIAEPGLLAKDGVVKISPDKSLSLSDGDFGILRPLVNKYRKMLVQ